MPLAKVLGYAAANGFTEAALREVVFGSDVFLEIEVEGATHWSYHEEFSS